jgi:hypothetical protein
MSALSQSLAELRDRLRLPEELSLTIDVDPANLI